MGYKNFQIRFLISLILFSLFLFGIFYYKFLFVFSLFIYLIIFIEILFNFNKFKYLLLFYILTSFLFLFLYLCFFYNLKFFFLYVFSIILFDTFSYIFGSKFGKKKILPKISPKKTFEGFILGYLFTGLSIFIISILINFDFNFKYLIFFNTIIIFSFFGDVLESIFKRKSQIKDSSNFLPGHGGFFDRFDSMILCNYILFFYYVY